MRTFLVADLHLGRSDDRNAAVITGWNETVAASDTVWVLGDASERGGLPLISHLNGRKRLVLGNRDPVSRVVRSGLFDEVVLVKKLPGLLLTHFPVHPTQIGHGRRNAHGHLHASCLPDKRYICVSVERLAFKPILTSSLAAR